MTIAILTSTIWLLYAVFSRFIFPYFAGYITRLIATLCFIVVPIANHVRMLFDIRRHNRQMGDAVAVQQISVVLRREKKVAIDMFVVAIVLLASLVPVVSMKVFELYYPQVHAIALPWALTVTFMTSAINPVFYLTRNPDLRNAVKSILKN